MAKYVYYFGPQGTEGSSGMRDLLGGKGADLAEMTSLGIPVPPGFTISTAACLEYFDYENQLPPGLWEAALEAMHKVEQDMGTKFGDKENPLLVSVRSGARVSMPGMMDTVLNLGLNDETVEGLIAKSNNPRFAYDAYRRLITMFGDVVMGVERKLFDDLFEKRKEEYGAKEDVELSAEALQSLIQPYKELVKRETGTDFPDDPTMQLKMGIEAVFKSWNTPRAVTYRKIHYLSDVWGTAVNVQVMVYGNMGDDSGTGVAFTRDPATGENKFYGEILMNAQGEDIVAGIRTPLSMEELRGHMPEIYEELLQIRQKLEQRFTDMQDIEFTMQEDRLYMLQTRTGKRTAQAAVRMALEMVEEGLIDRETAVCRVEPATLDQLLHPMFDPSVKVEVIAKGLPASPGAAVGALVFTAEEAERCAAEGEKVILVRAETSPEDIGGMNAAQGILTSRGGLTSHAAVVGRGMGKTCVVGCSEILIDEAKGELTARGVKLTRSDFISLNGSTGEVVRGKVKLVQPEMTDAFATLMSWADEFRSLGVYANADTPHDAQVARDLGAEGIGLCRTEHMFFEPERVEAMREVILSKDAEQRRRFLKKIEPMQKGDFKEILRVMDGYPVTIRLLDPPLHEFLPHTDEEVAELAKAMDVPVERLREAVESRKEFNPMLGHRGCRLGITNPEIYEMQARAILEAAAELVQEGHTVHPEIMIPLVGNRDELALTRQMVLKAAEEVKKEKGVNLEFLVGTMIELPRAALTADEIAVEAEFFSYGTNDLTQTVFGLSRDDAGTFLPYYVEHGIYPKDPFMTIDPEGVGALIKMGVEKGRKTRPNLKIGICGEHGGDPDSVVFCHFSGLDYVSCSPYRVPIARLAAAQARIKELREKN